MDYAELASELESACRDHDREFAARGYCPAVAEANDRIGRVHDQFAKASGDYWLNGNDLLIVELRARADTHQR